MGNVVITGTGPLYTLAEVKQHLRVDHSDDDATIQTYMDTAERAVLDYCNTAIVPFGKEAVFKTAAIMAVMQYYEQGSAAVSLPQNSIGLVDPYRWRRV